MKEIDEQQATQLERYLLGDLPEEDLHRLESRLLEQRDLFNRVETIEDDLVDRYVREELSDEDRGRFEERLLPSGRIRRRVAFARNLHRLTEERSTGEAGPSGSDDRTVGITPFRPRPEQRRPLATRLAWAACLVALIGAGVLALINVRLQGDLQRAVQGQEAATARALAAEQQASSLSGAVARARSDGADAEALQDELAASRDRIATLEHRTEELRRTAQQAEKQQAVAAVEKAAPSKVLFLALATRGRDQPTTLQLPAPDGAELQLDLDRLRPTGGLTVTLQKAGTAIWEASDLAPVVSGADSMLPVTLPEQILLPGTYRVEIRSADRDDAEPIAAYDLVVAR